MARSSESIDGRLSLASFEGQLHPITAQEAKGHGLKAWPSYDIQGDGVKYYPSLTAAEEPPPASDPDVRYRLARRGPGARRSRPRAPAPSRGSPFTPRT